MAKRRYSASKIARTPSLKRDIAELLAQYDENSNKFTVQQMLAYGHRGYISYNETDLCKMFDKLYTSQLVKTEEKRKSILEEKINPRHSWEVSRQQKSLEELEKSLNKFKEIAEELFEAAFLT